MASSLAQQLSQLAAARTDTAVMKRLKGKASLLFDVQKAADVDLQTIYGIGLQGTSRVWQLVMCARNGWLSDRAPPSSCRVACHVVRDEATCHAA